MLDRFLPSSCVIFFVALASSAAAGDTILFLRGGPGSGGFLGGGSDTHLSDVNDPSQNPGNTGWFELRLLLEGEGYTVQQVLEGPGGSSPIDLAALDLSDVAVIVFGSNNAPYPGPAADLLAEWVCGGGAALFISDANWGSNWGDAPSSDQPFLDHFDLVMNQDLGTYTLTRAGGDFVIGGVDRGTHPILAGPDGQVGTGDDVDSFDGEGVSPLTLATLLPGVDPIVLAKAKGNVRRNDAPGAGSITPAAVDDGALVVLEYGGGRVAGHFDRNTFFNVNGAGTSLHNNDNAQYAKNLFAWLAAAPGGAYGDGCVGAGGFVPRLALDGCPRPGAAVTLELDEALGGSTALLLFGTGKAATPLPWGCSLLVAPVLPVTPALPLAGVGPGQGDVAVPVTLPANVAPATVTLQSFVADPAAGGGGLASSNGLEVRVF